VKISPCLRYFMTYDYVTLLIELILAPFDKGIRMQAEACIRIPHHTTPAKPQRNTNTHHTRAIQPMT